ncbi:MAG: hypothetical protein ABW182_01020, partial [Sphingomonas sp.]
MRAFLLCATMVCACSISPVQAQRMRLPQPVAEPTPSPTPSPEPARIRRLPIQQTTPRPAPTPTPSPASPTTRSPFDRTPTAPIGASPQKLPVVSVKPTGTMALNIIDRGYAEADATGARTVAIAACVADQYGNPGDIKAMRYDIDLPGGHRTGEMTMFIQKGQKPSLNSPMGKKAEIIGNCRQVSFPLKPCEIAPGDYGFTIVAEFADRPSMIAKDETIVGEYPSSITLKPTSFESGVPQQVLGMVTAPCGAASGAKVTLSSRSGPPLTLTTLPSGAFSGNYTFTRPGKASLTASVVNNDRILNSETSFDTVPKPPAVAVAVLNQPKLAKVGTPTTFAGRVRHATSKVAMAGASVTFSYAGASCKAVSAGDGTATCALTIGEDKANLVNTSQVLAVAVADTESVAVEGLGKTALADKQGLVSFTFGGLIAMP